MLRASPTSLPKPIAAFLRELSAGIGEEAVAPLHEAFAAVDDEGLEVDDADRLMLVLSRIAGQARPLAERFAAIADVLNQKGRVAVTIGRDSVTIHERRS
jgi:hypothetical protein